MYTPLTVFKMHIHRNWDKVCICITPINMCIFAQHYLCEGINSDLNDAKTADMHTVVETEAARNKKEGKKVFQVDTRLYKTRLKEMRQYM